MRWHVPPENVAQVNTYLLFVMASCPQSLHRCLCCRKHTNNCERRNSSIYNMLIIIYNMLNIEQWLRMVTMFGFQALQVQLWPCQSYSCLRCTADQVVLRAAALQVLVMFHFVVTISKAFAHCKL